MNPPTARFALREFEEPLVSIIVLNWNGAKYLEECLDSIRSQSAGNYRLLVVDNNSSDGSVDLIRKNYPDVELLEFRENLGYTGANNTAAEITRGDFLLFLNIDTKLDRDYLKELTAYIQSHPRAKIIATKEYSYDGETFISQNDGFDFLGYGCSYRPGKTHTAPGCAFVIERNFFLELGGFDEKMYMYHEEIDICWRAALRGEAPENADRCMFYHAGGGSMPAWSIRRRYFGERNNIRSILQNYSYPILLLILPIYFFVNACETIYLLLTGQFKTIREAYWRAWVDNIKDLRDILRRHNDIQRKRVINDIQYLRKTRLVIGKWQGFIKLGKKVAFKDAYPK